MLNYDKEILTFEEQLDLLEERGLIIGNLTQALNYLKNIDDFGISATDFNITTKMEEQLYQSGLNSTMEYFKNMKKPS